MKGYIYLPIPKEFHSLYPEGGREVAGDDSEPHVTLVYFPEIKDGWLEKLEAICEQRSKTTPPIEASFGRAFEFPANDEGLIPRVVGIESAELHKLHDEIIADIEKAGLDFKEKFPNYKPHTTLEYTTEKGTSDKELPDANFLLSEIRFHTKDEDEQD